MAPVEPVFDLTCDANPHCRKKSLPCSCGLWGKDTEQVWRETGLWNHKDARNEYKKLLCPRQIEAKIEDRLERFVAYCALGVRKTGGIMRTGASPVCGTVIEEIEKHGNPDLESMSKELLLRLGCAAGVVNKKDCNAAKILN